MVIGCAYSAFQILHDVRVPVRLLPGVAARVNGRQIDADSVSRTVAGMDARERRSESATRHKVLSRMIDEELLVQHALDSGAAETSPEVRAALVRSAITRVNAEAASEPISDRELNEYFEAHKQVYATAARFDVTPFYFEAHDASASDIESGHSNAARSSPTRRDDVEPNRDASTTAGAAIAERASNRNGDTRASARATAARAAIKAGALGQEVFNTTDAPPFGSPGRQVTPHTLANYFGPATTDAVNQLAPGETTEVTPLGNGFVFIYLNAKTPGEVPSLASIRDLVAADAMRDRQEHALEALLVSLHQAANIEFAASPGAAPPTAASLVSPALTPPMATSH
jgi:parvulin-like peptidyl-prolyl isomerase